MERQLTLNIIAHVDTCGRECPFYYEYSPMEIGPCFNRGACQIFMHDLTRNSERKYMRLKQCLEAEIKSDHDHDLLEYEYERGILFHDI